MKKSAVVFLALALMLCALSGCGKKEEAAGEDMPENIISYDEKENFRLIPDGKTVEVGEVEEAQQEPLPSEEELGEYEEIFMEGDILDETSRAGWVISVGLKSITVNTYNELTTYLIGETASPTASHIKAGDAVFIHYTADEETGEKTIYEMGRVRVEDEPLSKEEILAQYGDGEETQE